MGFNLREALNLNNKDKQKKTPPAQTIVPPKQTFFNKVRDVVDPNTQADIYRRQQAGRFAPYQDNTQGLGKIAKGFGKGITETVDTGIQAGRFAAAGLTGNANAAYSAGNQLKQSASQSLPGAIYKPAEDAVVNTLYKNPKAIVQGLGQAFGDGQQGSFGDKFARAEGFRKQKAQAMGLTGDFNRDVAAPGIESGINALTLGTTGFAGKEFGKQAVEQGFKAAAKTALPVLAETTGYNALQGAGGELYNEDPTLKGALVKGATNAAVGTAGDLAFGAIPATASYYKAGGKLPTTSLVAPKLTPLNEAGSIRNPFARGPSDTELSIPRPLKPSEVIRDPAQLDLINNAREILTSGTRDPKTINALEQGLFDLKKQTGLDFRTGSVEQRLQNVTQFLENNGEALSRPQPTTGLVSRVKERLSSPLGEGGYVKNPLAKEPLDTARQAQGVLEANGVKIPKDGLQERTQKKPQLQTGSKLEEPLSRDGPLGSSESLAKPSTNLDVSKYVKEQSKLQDAAKKSDKGRFATAKETFATKALDSLSPIEKPVEKALGGRKNNVELRNALDRSLRSDTIAGQHIKDAGLDKIIESVPDAKEFDQYLISKHAQDLEKNGVKTGRDLGKDAQLQESLAPKYEKQAQALKQYNDGLLDKTVDYGLISKETADYLKQKYPNYVPFERIFTDDELQGKGNGSGPASLSKQTIVKRIEGSERAIASPTESILAKTHDVFAQGERNRAATAIADTRNIPGNPLGIKPLRTAEDVSARIDLYSQAKELKPAQAKLQQLLKTQNSWGSKLQRELDKLNKQGLDLALSNNINKTDAPILSGTRDVLKGTKKVNNPLRDIPTLTGTVETTQFSRSMTAKETKATVNNLVNLPKKELDSIRSKIATRENKLGPILDKIEDLRTAIEGVKNNREALFDEAKLHADAQSRGKTTISTFKNGIKEIYETTPEVAAAAKSLNKEQMNLATKILSYPTRALRLGATGVNAGFALANVAKDVASAAINSEHPLRASLANPTVFLDSLKAAVNHGSKQYGELVREGAGGTSFDIARSSVKDTVERIRSDRSHTAKALYTVKHPGELLRAVEDTIGRSEEFGRAVQYFGNKEAATKAGKSTAQAVAYGADAARNNTVNFARAGEYGRILNSVLPYFNAGIQGSRTFTRNLRDRPIQTGAKVALTAFLPVAATTSWNLNDPKRKEAYDNLQDYEKEGNIIIVPPNPKKDAEGRWNVIKIPVSQEVANLNNSVRNGIEKLHGDKSFDFKKLAGNLAGTATSINFQSGRQTLNQVIPQAVKPAIEGVTNQNLFTGNQIVPDYQKDLPAKEQTGDYTSGTANAFGKLTNTSPRQIDNFIRTTTGGAGQQVVNLADNILAKTGVTNKDNIQGKSIKDSILNRFNSGAGKSDYQVDKEAEDKVKKSGTAQASGGKVSANIDGKTKTYDTKEEADDAQFESDFKKGSSKIQERNGQVYIKNKSKQGFTTKPKAEYDYDNVKSDTSLSIDRAKSKGDVKSWYTEASKKYDAIDAYKKTLDPETDRAKINSLTKEQEDLADEAGKYKSYGDSFTKPKKGKKSSGGSNAYQYKLSDVLGSSTSISKSLKQLLAEARIK